MKPFLIFTVVFLFLGICSVAAQDLIVLRDGNMIEAKVIEISPTEIRYKRSDNLEGPTIVIPADRVLSIKYKNGTQEIINANANTGQKNTQTKPVTLAMDPDKFIFAMSANPGSLLTYPSFSSLCFEFGKGHFNSEVHLFFPALWEFGLGGLATFNYFWPNSVGGFYLGGGVGSIYPYYVATIGLNIGWKFVTRPGIYFRTGAYLGAAYGGFFVYFKPDLAIGYCFK
jgi:hypothetical protein